MSVPQNETLLEDLAEEWHSRLVADGWRGDACYTWEEARNRARAEWAERD